MKFLSKSLEDTKRFAAEFLAPLSVAESGATVVGLFGNLGSGKTTFVQYVAELLGVKEYLTSPTFVILKRFTIQPARTYQNPLGTGGDSRFRNLIHIDAYRLKNGGELQKLGWQEISADPQNIIFIEWPEHVADVLPKNLIKINFEFIDEITRKFKLTPCGDNR